jgi:hypothetical protein
MNFSEKTEYMPDPGPGGREIRFKNYRLENVYLRATRAQRAEMVGFLA